MKLTQSQPFAWGYTPITDQASLHPEMRMDFGVLKLKAGKQHLCDKNTERAFLLMTGTATLRWNETSAVATRKDIFRESPSCLHVPSGTAVSLTAETDCEFCITGTCSDADFQPVFYTPDMCRSELRGHGLMQETSTRVVRTLFDKTNAPDAQLVLGEVIAYPGKWSSYPPHHHPQPEIYHYRFTPEMGYGFAELGDDVVKVHHQDTVLINAGLTHPQTTAPGFAMYYLWAIRHLENDPYTIPVFVPGYEWLQRPGAVIFPEQEEES